MPVRTAVSSATPVHHAARRRGGRLAARGARAVAQGADHRLFGRDCAVSKCSATRSIPAASAMARLSARPGIGNAVADDRTAVGGRLTLCERCIHTASVAARTCRQTGHSSACAKELPNSETPREQDTIKPRIRASYGPFQRRSVAFVGGQRRLVHAQATGRDKYFAIFAEIDHFVMAITAAKQWSGMCCSP